MPDSDSSRDRSRSRDFANRKPGCPSSRARIVDCARLDDIWTVGGECAPLAAPVLIRERFAQGIGVSTRHEVDPSKRSNPMWPERLPEPRLDFPLVCRLVDTRRSQCADLEHLGLQARTLLELRLRRHGAVLLKGLPISTPDDFGTFVGALGWTPVRKHGVSERVEYAKDVFGASDDVPDDFCLAPHNEQAYYKPDSIPSYPRRILFCSIVPAESGGETPVARNAEVLAALRPDVVERLRPGVLYEQRMPSGSLDDPMSQNLGGAQPWQKAYNVTSKAEAEEAVRSQGCNYAWGAEGELVVRRPGLAFVPSTQPEVDGAAELWLNQAHNFYSFTPLYADGTKIEEDVLSHINAELWRHSVGFTWETGDVLCIDNEVCTHARTSFRSPRKNLAAFFE